MDTLYLSNVLGGVLNDCLSELVMVMPEDPIEWIAHWLYRSNDCQLYYFEKSHFNKELQLTQEAIESDINQHKECHVRMRVEYEQLEKQIHQNRIEINKMKRSLAKSKTPDKESEESHPAPLGSSAPFMGRKSHGGGLDRMLKMMDRLSTMRQAPPPNIRHHHHSHSTQQHPHPYHPPSEIFITETEELSSMSEGESDHQQPKPQLRSKPIEWRKPIHKPKPKPRPAGSQRTETATSLGSSEYGDRIDYIDASYEDDRQREELDSPLDSALSSFPPPAAAPDTDDDEEYYSEPEEPKLSRDPHPPHTHPHIDFDDEHDLQLKKPEPPLGHAPHFPPPRHVEDERPRKESKRSRDLSHLTPPRRSIRAATASSRNSLFMAQVASSMGLTVLDLEDEFYDRHPELGTSHMSISKLSSKISSGKSSKGLTEDHHTGIWSKSPTQSPSPTLPPHPPPPPPPPKRNMQGHKKDEEAPRSPPPTKDHRKKKQHKTEVSEEAKKTWKEKEPKENQKPRRKVDASPSASSQRGGKKGGALRKDKVVELEEHEGEEQHESEEEHGSEEEHESEEEQAIADAERDNAVHDHHRKSFRSSRSSTIKSNRSRRSHKYQDEEEEVHVSTWCLDCNLGLVCDHPILGQMRARCPFIPPETPAWWEKQQFLEVTLYDPEVYSVGFPKGAAVDTHRVHYGDVTLTVS